MGLRKAGSKAPEPAEAAAPVAEPVYPEVKPLDDKAIDSLASMIAMSDKDMRIGFAGVYQALIQSQPLYAAHNIMDAAQWHAVIEEEFDYFERRILERSRKE